jgi:hypothetical protein
LGRGDADEARLPILLDLAHRGYGFVDDLPGVRLPQFDVIGAQSAQRLIIRGAQPGRREIERCRVVACALGGQDDSLPVALERGAEPLLSQVAAILLLQDSSFVSLVLQREPL